MQFTDILCSAMQTISFTASKRETTMYLAKRISYIYHLNSHSDHLSSSPLCQLTIKSVQFIILANTGHTHTTTEMATHTHVDSPIQASQNKMTATPNNIIHQMTIIFNWKKEEIVRNVQCWDLLLLSGNKWERHIVWFNSKNYIYMLI